MSHCPITYEATMESRYSQSGLRSLSRDLKELKTLPYDAEQQRREATLRATKMSIQGMQPKMSARLNVKGGQFEIVDIDGRYILKPQHLVYPSLPENEGLTMHLAGLCGIEAPTSGLVLSQDGTWTYFVRRFDRVRRKDKIPLEDFAQLSGLSRDTKYDFSMEKLIPILDRYCTFPAIEKVKLLKRCLFNFVVGNEDMHLKNFSLISWEGKIELAPAYDYLNTTVAFLAAGRRIEDIEEIALPLDGKKRHLTRKTWIEYFAAERIGLPGKIVDGVLEDLFQAQFIWQERIADSFLPISQKESYTTLLQSRLELLSS
jgi:serine/threonine-protein kinase HipA